MILSVSLTTACWPKVAPVEAKHSTEVVLFDPVIPPSIRLEQEFAAPKEGLLDYDGMTQALAPVIDTLQITVSEELIFSIFLDESSGSYSYDIWDDVTRLLYHVQVKADTGELISTRHNIIKVRDLDSIDMSEDRFDKLLDNKKAMSIAIEYCEKLYAGKTVVACCIAGAMALFDEDDSSSVGIDMLFDDGMTAQVDIKVPGYDFLGIHPLLPESEFPAQGEMEKLYGNDGSWMDNR